MTHLSKKEDLNMEEMGTVVVRDMGYGRQYIHMTRREALLKGYMVTNGPALPWKSYKDALKEKQKEENEKRLKEKAEEERKRTILNDKSASMEEMGTVVVRDMGYGRQYIHMTRREALLKGYMVTNGPALPWKSYKDALKEKQKEENEKRLKEKAEEERKRTILNDKSASMEEMGTVVVRDMGYGRQYIHITRREAMLYGYMVGSRFSLPWKPDNK